MDSGKAETFGQWLKKYREGKGIPQGDFAQQVGITQAHLSRVETGSRLVSAELVIAIARALKLAPLDLLIIAGFMESEEKQEPSPRPTIKSTARKNIEALFDILSPEEQEQAIEILETFRKRREAEIKAASQRKLKKG